jgi:LPS-assembly protein
MTRRIGPRRAAAATTPRRRRPRAAVLLAGLLAVAGAAAAHAQLGAVRTGKEEPVAKDQPVFYQSDSAEYDRDTGIVTLAGHVDIWQGNRDLRADRVTYDRNTGVAAATGHVVLLEPDGQVLFADYAELSQGMKEGILRGMRAQLAENGKLAANGARRTDAQVNELSRVIYSTCNACAKHPDAPLLWDIRARSAVQDVPDKRIEYSDAVVDIYGVPVAYFPYLTQPDPSAKRASGFLVPSIGDSKYLGAFVEVPYFWVIDDSTDATIAPVLATQTGPALDAQFRHRFNNGTVTVNASVAYNENSLQSDVSAKGQFAIDDEWRWGFDLERASSETYMRDFQISGNSDVLTSQIYLEGFGQGSYSKLDARAYQGLTSSIVSAELPFVLPRYQYSFVGEPDALGGRFALDAGAFNVLRQVGTNTQRADLRLDWERPATGALGDLWKLVLHVDGAGYDAHQLDQNPTWGPQNVASTAQGMPTAAVKVNWPLERDAGSWGTQVIEPIAQLIAAPNGSSYGIVRNAAGQPINVNTLVPNEDSLDFEFTDADLFNLNRFPGIDRLEGGLRANVALHGAWYFPDGQQIDAQVGQAYREHPDNAFPVGSGLNQTVSDVVSHVSYIPSSWLDFTARQRFDPHSFDLRYMDALVSGGPSWLRLSTGYLYSAYNPFLYYDTVPTGNLGDTPRNEITVGASTQYGPWKVHVSARRNLQNDSMVSAGAGGSYENECFIFSVDFYRRYTSVDFDNGATTILFQITLKTVGTFGFHGL